ncbi:HepT-like ribonuclease domain-containing protein [Aphanothece sacrum]|uniref:Nucleotidyltransferase n=1 Tax=Aphanothece sacrum FPU1 TaxID=1920663 RepID=A0A401IF76_APHSA|nr:HepT-like ribonuclease domain-containing protein [Aphanothece sacrum]GBF79952.1 nucleotidyltransferase [Aphanothece sacrum FPU1]GBF83828.1 nucleotidyltransferase [Aphanothece sacrum FPU3]
MSDKDYALIYEIFDQIDEGISRIFYYFAPIQSPIDFTKNYDNQMRLDAISMMLIAIGESIKKLEKKISPSQFERFPNVDWRGAKGIRDILSHTYFQIQPEVIFQTCREDIPILQTAIQALKSEYNC